MIDVNQVIADFTSVADLAGVSIPEDAITAEVLGRPHTPPTALPPGKMAVYVFLCGDSCLKVGKVGPRSQARYTRQHYNPNSFKSNLSKSILKKGLELGFPSLSETAVGNWIKTETDRVNFLLDKKFGIPVLSLLESFLPGRLRSKFEGFDSQK
jgi:hypothetical protein